MVERQSEYVFFSVWDLVQCQQRVGQVSEDPSKFVEGFQALTLALDLPWKDVQIARLLAVEPRSHRN